MTQIFTEAGEFILSVIEATPNVVLQVELVEQQVEQFKLVLMTNVKY